MLEKNESGKLNPLQSRKIPSTHRVIKKKGKLGCVKALIYRFLTIKMMAIAAMATAIMTAKPTPIMVIV
jgi:hypothetical protein